MYLTKKIEQIPSIIRSVDQRFFVFCNYIFLFSIFAHAIFIPIFYSIGNTIVLINNILALFLDIICLKLNYSGFMKSAPALWILGIFYHALYCIFAFGWDHGYYYYFLTLVIIVFFSRWPLALRLILTVFLCTAIIFMFVYTHTHLPITKVQDHTVFFMHAYNAAANFAAVAYASIFYRKYSEQMEAQLLQLANIDALTGIYNRRCFQQSAEAILKNYTSCTNEFAFLLLDVDYFKKINDSFGHAVGDIALQKVAEILSHSLRQEDILGRIGGEEFGILLVNVDHSEALQIAERIRKKIEDTTLLINETTQMNLSISIGLTIPREKDETLYSMMVRADEALYQAKNNGRNRVEAII